MTDNTGMHPKQQGMYLAGTGMVTALGANTQMTTAAIDAGISAYQSSEFFSTENDQPMTAAMVPQLVFDGFDSPIDMGSQYSEQYDHIIKMAIIACREAISSCPSDLAVPLVLALPENHAEVTYIDPPQLISNLVMQPDLPFAVDSVYCISGGRAAGILALEKACELLSEAQHDYVLIGGSDSYMGFPRLGFLDAQQRVLKPQHMDGFVPGEGAGFLLLCREPELALQQNGRCISIAPPGVAREPGHVYAEPDIPCLGDGLDSAFKQALQNASPEGIQSIYASLNGEQAWGKEFGVALMRNNDYWCKDIATEHPAQYYGDLGSATAPVLLVLSATRLLGGKALGHLVYASSDGPWRGAVHLQAVSPV